MITTIAIVFLCIVICIGLLFRQALNAHYEARELEARRLNAEFELKEAKKAQAVAARAVAGLYRKAFDQQAEITSTAIDAAQAMTDDIARLVSAMQDAILLIGGKPADWKRTAPTYGCDPHLYTPATLKEAAIAAWTELLAEVQAGSQGTPIDDAPPLQPRATDAVADAASQAQPQQVAA